MFNYSGTTQMSRAVQLSVFHTAAALVLGSAIESAMPLPREGSSLSTLAFETAVQVGLNGAAVGLASRYIAADDDPTAGIPFGAALLASQPGLERRLAILSQGVRGRMREGAVLVTTMSAQAPGGE